MITVKLTQNGNSECINLPKVLIAQLGWQRGDKIGIDVNGRRLEISKLEE